MTKSLDSTQISIVRPAGTVRPMGDHKNGPIDDNDLDIVASFDGTDDNDYF